MLKHKVTFYEKLQIIGFAINVLVLIALAAWNIYHEERLAKLEYDELAPRIVIYREVKLDAQSDNAFYLWVIRNNGRIAAENVILTIFSNSEFLFEDCALGVPFDNIPKRVAGDHLIFENITLSPQGTISVSCKTKPGSVKAFIEKHKVSPDVVPSLNCKQAVAAYDVAMLLLLPNLGVIGNNVEPSRITYCVANLSDVYK
jgi:hypothetical protein